MINPTQPDTTTPVHPEGSYKVYTAILTQASTNAPIPRILNNTIGNIIWTRSSNGDYRGTLSGVFTEFKTWLSMFNYMWDGNTENFLSRLSTNEIQVKIEGGDDMLDGAAPALIEIRVYY